MAIAPCHQGAEAEANPAADTAATAPTEKASWNNGMAKAIDRLMAVGDGTSGFLDIEKLEIEFTAARGGAPRIF